MFLQNNEKYENNIVITTKKKILDLYDNLQQIIAKNPYDYFESQGYLSIFSNFLFKFQNVYFKNPL